MLIFNLVLETDSVSCNLKIFFLEKSKQYFVRAVTLSSFEKKFLLQFWRYSSDPAFEDLWRTQPTRIKRRENLDRHALFARFFWDSHNNSLVAEKESNQSFMYSQKRISIHCGTCFSLIKGKRTVMDLLGNSVSEVYI